MLLDSQNRLKTFQYAIQQGQMMNRKPSFATIILALSVIGAVVFSKFSYSDESKVDSKTAQKADPRDLFEDKYIRSVFKELSETSLIEKAKGKTLKDQTIYRFTWIRSFHRPICITVHKKEEQIALTYKILEHKQYDAKMEEEKTISIKKKEYDAFLAAIEEADFFKMGSEYRVEQIWRWDDSRKLWNIPSGSSTDGADWILEYCAERSYYINDRRNASATAFGKACIQLIKLSGLKKEKIY